MADGARTTVTPDPDLELEDGELVVAQVVIYRIMGLDGSMRDAILAVDGQDDDLDLITAVGMLAVAQHTLLSDDDD